MGKLKQLLKKTRLSWVTEQTLCSEFMGLLSKEIRKLVDAKDSIDRRIRWMKDDYREKAMVLCGQFDPITKKPYMRAVQGLIISQESKKKQEELENNPYFMGLLAKQERMMKKWERLAKEFGILNDLLVWSDQDLLKKGFGKQRIQKELVFRSALFSNFSSLFPGFSLAKRHNSNDNLNTLSVIPASSVGAGIQLSN